MTTRRPSPSLVVAVLALLLATGSTSYAAGLARNSVGTVQLKDGAVTAAKIKDGAVAAGELKDGSITGNELKDGTVGGADLRDGSVGSADLAAGVLPATRSLVRNGIQDTGGQVPAITAHGVAVTMGCDATNHEIDLRVGGAGGVLVELTGASSRRNVDQDDTQPVMRTGAVQLVVGASTFGTNGSVVFDGTARALPDGDPVHLTVGGFVQRGLSPATPTYCDVRVFVEPLS